MREETSGAGVAALTLADVNGDGYIDVIVTGGGAPPFGNHAFVYRGSSTGIATSPDDDLASPPVSGQPGNVIGLALLGDVNGDGLSDFGVVSVNGVYTPLIYQGATGAIPQTPALILTGVNSLTYW